MQDAEQPLGAPLVRHAVDKALSNLQFVQQGSCPDAVEQAAVQLSERERIRATIARATLPTAITQLGHRGARVREQFCQHRHSHRLDDVMIKSGHFTRLSVVVMPPAR